MGGEKRIGFYLFEGAGDGFLAKGTADLFESVELAGRAFLHEIYVGKATL